MITAREAYSARFTKYVYEVYAGTKIYKFLEKYYVAKREFKTIQEARLFIDVKVGK